MLVARLKQLVPPSIFQRPLSTMAFTKHSTLTLNHTCIRVKDPKKSVDFYTKQLGMKLFAHKKFPEMKFDLYFLGYPSGGDDSAVFARSGVLELTHNYGTESDPEYKVNNGNEEPHRGFGHTCISVDNIDVACAKFEEAGVVFKKRLVDGRQKDIAFVLDPDGYWVEVIQNRLNYSATSTDVSTYKFNHTMIRVKDHEKSLKFYREVLGMKLLTRRDFEEAKFSLFFLAYHHDDAFVEGTMPKSEQNKIEGVLELTWNWGTEKDADFKYHNGNDQPQGYGHIGISVEDPAEFCADIEAKYGDSVSWGLKFNQGKMKEIAFIKDPDNYAIEILPPHPKL